MKDKVFLFFAIDREREHQSLQEDPTSYAELSRRTVLRGPAAEPAATDSPALL